MLSPSVKTLLQRKFSLTGSYTIFLAAVKFTICGEGGGAAVTRWTLEREVPGSNPGWDKNSKFKIWVWGGVVWHGEALNRRMLR